MKQLPDSPDVTCFSPEEQRALILRRLERVKEIYTLRVNKYIRTEINKTAVGEDIRCWLEKFAVGNGLDICSGRYPISIENAMGVDESPEYSLGATFDFRGDNLATIDNGGMDFIVCNAFDWFAQPVGNLREWYRVLRPGGKVAFTCTNAECYDVKDRMLNGKRQFLYTPHTMRIFMHNIGFQNVKVQTHSIYILVEGNK